MNKLEKMKLDVRKMKINTTKESIIIPSILRTFLSIFMVFIYFLLIFVPCNASQNYKHQIVFLQKINHMKDFINDWKLMLLMSLTLGLAPFVPEPHLFGKIRWIVGGAVGMQPADWFDFLMHATPWILLIRIGILKTMKK